MSSSFLKFIYTYFSTIFTVIFFIFIIIIYTFETDSSLANANGYVWPVPGFTYISSYFGYRDSPTAGASTYHSGIDIPATEGSDILAICNGIVTFASWGAGGGYTIVVENEDVSVSYCHLSPIFIVNRNDQVKAGQVISHIGPKNVYGITNNPYRDSYGQPTNGATTGCHLHLSIKKDGKAVNPLEYLSIPN